MHAYHTYYSCVHMQWMYVHVPVCVYTYTLMYHKLPAARRNKRRLQVAAAPRRAFLEMHIAFQNFCINHIREQNSDFWLMYDD
jgi:hypothetical protein